MIDGTTPAWALGFFGGATAGFWFGVRWRRPPYSSAAIAFRATAEDAAKVRSKFIDPLVGESWPEPMTVEEWARSASKPPPPCRQPAPSAGPPSYGWGPGQLNPPPPAPGMRRKYLWNPAQMAECGGPCWEAQDPRRCTCGALWRDVPIRFDEGQTQRGNSNGEPTTPKPSIKPQPTGGRLIRSDQEPLPPSNP